MSEAGARVPRREPLAEAVEQMERAVVADERMDPTTRLRMLAALDAMRSRRPTCRLRGARMLAELGGVQPRDKRSDDQIRGDLGV